MVAFNSTIALDPARAPRYGGVIGRKATFVVPTGMVLADTVNLFKVPKGAILMDMWASNVAGGQTFDVGDAVDDDRFLVAVPVSATAIARASLLAGLNFVFADETQIVGVFNTGNPTAAGIITVAATYMLSA